MQVNVKQIINSKASIASEVKRLPEADEDRDHHEERLLSQTLRSGEKLLHSRNRFLEPCQTSWNLYRSHEYLILRRLTCAHNSCVLADETASTGVFQMGKVPLNHC